jgi:dTMP kinase
MTYIVIDGLDASGKSTQADRLSRYLNSRGRKFCLRLHPSSDSFFGIKARQFLYSRGKSAHFASALFYMLDVVRSVLLFNSRKYDCVIYVRYLMGTAYLPSPLHVVAYHFFTLFVPKSNAMFFLDVSPDEAYRRISTRSDQEMFEGLAELKKIRRKALLLALIGKWTILDAGKPVDEVEREIRKHLVSISAL